MARPVTRGPASDAPVASTAVRSSVARRRDRDVGVFLLATMSGATDAIGFIALGGAFTSVMTGNMVLFGLGVARGNTSELANTATAIICFILGCAIGARVAGKPNDGDPTWPRPVTMALIIEFVLFGLYTMGFESAGLGHPGATLQPVLLALTAMGLGVQSAAVQRFGQSGLSTTYMTGTLTTLVARLATGGRVREVLPSLRLLLGLIGGAVVGGLLALHVRPLAPLLQLALLVAVLAVANLNREWRR
jgi:uncharacterized membrane protein YoaK (UPF0700 family)